MGDMISMDNLYPEMDGWKWFSSETELVKKLDVINQNVEHLVAFKDLADAANNLTDGQKEEFGPEAFHDIDWYALSVGFFVARGVDWSTSYDLALVARYNFQYWC